jgi:Flp pilus assembly protein TadG
MRSERGAELIEFALTLPLLLLLVLGIIEFGFMFQEYEVVTNAAREGARLGTLIPSAGYTTGEAQTRAIDYLQAGGLDPLRATAVVNLQQAPITGTVPLKCMQVANATVTYLHPVPFVSGIMSYFGGNQGTITLRGFSVMRTEGGSTACPAGP